MFLLPSRGSNTATKGPLLPTTTTASSSSSEASTEARPLAESTAFMMSFCRGAGWG
jgi:hypothetical protein